MHGARSCRRLVRRQPHGVVNPSPAGRSVTEQDVTTGALVQIIQGSRFVFDDPHAVPCDGTAVWVANVDASLTGFSSLIRGE